MPKPQKMRFTAAQTLTLGFAAIILVGGMLLTLPLANRSGEWSPFLGALFTATSSTCVTGLVVYDTWTQFTLFGQLIILFLIQIGGLGFMTMAIFFPLILGRRIGLRERSNLMEAVSSLQLGGVVRLVKHILFGTLLVEGIGAILLASRFIPVFGLLKGAWYGVFHAVSSFCNAGFDLLGCIEPYTSLVPFADDVVVNLTVCALIAIGGIGFIVWDDMVVHGWHFAQYSFHARVMLIFTGSLIFGGTVLLLITEHDTVLAGLPLGDRLLRALFQAVSPRTAGFNTVDLTALSESGFLVTMFLMLVGAGPGSTGGGMKVTTFMVLFATITCHMRGASDTNLLNRRVAPNSVKKAFCSATFYCMLLLLAAFAVTLVEGMMPMKDILFECISAIGTVGLSTGVTREMEPVSQLVLILLMFAGRVGSLTVFMTVTEHENERHLRNPIEKIIVG